MNDKEFTIMQDTPTAPVIFGALYEYVCGLPRGVKGCRYRLRREILDVPSYQQKLLIEALDGPDKGLLFCCSPDNFSRRYRLLEAPYHPGEQG